MNPPNWAETNCGLSHCTRKERSDLTTVTHLGCGAQTSPRAAHLPCVTPAHQTYGLSKAHKSQNDVLNTWMFIRVWICGLGFSCLISWIVTLFWVWVGFFWLCLFVLDKNKSKYQFQYIIYIPPLVVLHTSLCALLFKNHCLHVPILSPQRSVVRLGEEEAASLSKNTLGQVPQLKGCLFRAW